MNETNYAAAKNTINVHLIEDDEDDVHWLKRVMTKHMSDINMSVHKNGQVAIESLLTLSEKHIQVDLILLDINMPTMNGYEFLTIMRATDQLKLIPVVVITSATDQESFQQAYLHGANSVICKDRIFDSSADLIQLMMDYWLHLTERPRVGWEFRSEC